MKTSIKLLIFEPYEWAYCGGAIGVVAKDFKQAVDIIIEEDKERARQAATRQEEINRAMGSETKADRYRSFRRKYFSRTPKDFVKDSYDQWLLTHELTIIEDGRPNPRILFNNWNYA